MDSATSVTAASGNAGTVATTTYTNFVTDLSLAVNDKGGKDKAYRILNVMHNLPRAFYGKDILGGTEPISLKDAVDYARLSMTSEMKEKYIDSTF